MQSKIIQVGNSLGIVIPSYMAKVLEAEKGTKIDVELQGKRIIIKKGDEE